MTIAASNVCIFRESIINSITGCWHENPKPTRPSLLGSCIEISHHLEHLFRAYTRSGKCRHNGASGIAQVDDVVEIVTIRLLYVFERSASVGHVESTGCKRNRCCIWLGGMYCTGGPWDVVVAGGGSEVAATAAGARNYFRQKEEEIVHVDESCFADAWWR